MDIRPQAQLLLRDAGYALSRWRDDYGTVIRFEDLSTIGFLFEFMSGVELLKDHSTREEAVLTSHAPVFRSAGDKAWNVYSVFLTAEAVDIPTERAILQIEEDLSMTRKIARAGIDSEANLRVALLPLLPIMSQPEVGRDDYASRIRDTLEHLVSQSAVDAFMGTASINEIAQILMEE